MNEEQRRLTMADLARRYALMVMVDRDGLLAAGVDEALKALTELGSDLAAGGETIAVQSLPKVMETIHEVLEFVIRSPETPRPELHLSVRVFGNEREVWIFVHDRAEPGSEYRVVDCAVNVLGLFDARQDLQTRVVERIEAWMLTRQHGDL